MTTPKKGDLVGWDKNTPIEHGFVVLNVYLNGQGLPVMTLQPVGNPDPRWIQCWTPEGGTVIKTFEERTAERLMV